MRGVQWVSMILFCSCCVFVLVLVTRIAESYWLWWDFCWVKWLAKNINNHEAKIQTVYDLFFIFLKINGEKYHSLQCSFEWHNLTLVYIILSFKTCISIFSFSYWETHLNKWMRWVSSRHLHFSGDRTVGSWGRGAWIVRDGAAERGNRSVIQGGEGRRESVLFLDLKKSRPKDFQIYMKSLLLLLLPLLLLPMNPLNYKKMGYESLDSTPLTKAATCHRTLIG